MSVLEDTLNTFNEMGIIKKIIVGCCAVFLVLMIIHLAGHAILGIPLDSYTDASSTKYTDFTYLDVNGDGGLSFDELKYYDRNSQFTISQSDLKEMFDRCDKNDNGLLIGGEYDHYVIKVKNHINDLENKQKQAEKERQEALKNQSKSSSSSSSSSSKSYRYGEDGLCRWCGSDQISRSSDGMGNFECDDCGSYLYWSDIIDIDDLRCPNCKGHVYSKNNGNSFKCKNCGKSWDYRQL